MIAQANGTISITGIGAYAPERVVTNDDLSELMDTSDEWIVERTGIRERRVAADDQALSDLALPAARAALEQAGTPGADVDLIIVATVTADMAFPSAAAILADELGADEAGAYDLSAGCTGFMYAVAQGYAPPSCSETAPGRSFSTASPKAVFSASSSARTARAGRSSTCPPEGRGRLRARRPSRSGSTSSR